MIYINSNLTNREAYALHGKLDDARMQELLDLEDEHQPAENECYVHEASAQYPAEDFLHDNIKILQKLAKNLRGGNKETLIEVIAALDCIQMHQSRATEYAREELGKIK